jgi:hypothetical protein
MSQVAERLTEKLQTLSPQQLAEVDTFVSELLDPQATSLVRSAAQLSEPSLSRLWNNPEDDVYDDL